MIGTKQGANQHRWKTAAKDKAFAMLLPQVIIETKAETLLKVLQMGDCLDKCLSPAAAQLLHGHELAAVAVDS